MTKDLLFTKHSLNKISLRGTTEEEVRIVVSESEWKPAKRGKSSTEYWVDFNSISRVNNKHG